MDEINTLKSIVGDAHVFVGETGGAMVQIGRGAMSRHPLLLCAPPTEMRSRRL